MMGMIRSRFRPLFRFLQSERTLSKLFAANLTKLFAGEGPGPAFVDNAVVIVV